jgi:hypothetical protein
MCHCRDAYFNRVLAPEGEFLSFAQPNHMDVVNVENAGAIFHKRKYPKLRRPGCRLRFSHLPGVVKKDFLSLLTTRDIPIVSLMAIPDKYSDARRGIRDSSKTCFARSMPTRLIFISDSSSGCLEN